MNDLPERAPFPMPDVPPWEPPEETVVRELLDKLQRYDPDRNRFALVADPGDWAAPPAAGG